MAAIEQSENKQEEQIAPPSKPTLATLIAERNAEKNTPEDARRRRRTRIVVILLPIVGLVCILVGSLLIVLAVATDDNRLQWGAGAGLALLFVGISLMLPSAYYVNLYKGSTHRNWTNI